MEALVNEKTSPVAVLPGDFAAGERTEPLTHEEEREAEFQGDFAAGGRTEPLTPQEEQEADLHGDFAAGGRTEPLTPEDDAPGTFADTTEQDRPA